MNKKYFEIYDYVLQMAQPLQASSNSVLIVHLRIVFLKTASDSSINLILSSAKHFSVQ